MNNIDKKKDDRTLFLLMIISIALYIVGLTLIPKESYHRGTDDMEEYNLIYIKGVGEVFAYRDIYMFALEMLVISMFLSIPILGKDRPLEGIVFGKCVIGVLLIYITTSATLISTILFWAGSVLGVFMIFFNRERKVW